MYDILNSRHMLYKPQLIYLSTWKHVFQHFIVQGGKMKKG